MPRPSRLLVPALLVLLVSTPGCFTTQYVLPTALPTTTYDVLGSFQVKKRASWVILGLVPLREADVEAAVAREVERLDGDAAVNVVVMAQFDALDTVVGLVVGGLFNTRSYTVTGDVVKLRGRLGEAAPAPEGVIVGGIRYRYARP